MTDHTIDTSKETEAEVEGRKHNPYLERVLDEIQVALDNDTSLTDGGRKALVDAHAAVLGIAKANRPSRKDLDDQSKREAELKKPK